MRRLARAMQVPLHATHQALGARFTPFGGFDMPVQYASILAEHAAVRQSVGVFDVSHMSNLWVSGPGAAEALSHALAADAQRLEVGRARYTVALRADGTILDDLIFYRMEQDLFHVLPNAGMNQAISRHITDAAPAPVTMEDASRQLCILAVQGPDAPAAVERAIGAGSPKRFRWTSQQPDVRRGFVGGTGYTGEAGCELIVPNAKAEQVWDQLVQVGAVPCGLGARDTLRLEMGYCLAPNEFSGGRTPLEAGLGWVVDWEHPFIGQEALVAQRDAGDHDVLVGLVTRDRGVPRAGCDVFDGGVRVGGTSSGSLNPTSRTGMALAFVRGEAAAVGHELAIDVRGRRLDAMVCKPPLRPAQPNG